MSKTIPLPKETKKAIKKTAKKPMKAKNVWGQPKKGKV